MGNPFHHDFACILHSVLLSTDYIGFHLEPRGSSIADWYEERELLEGCRRGGCHTGRGYNGRQGISLELLEVGSLFEFDEELCGEGVQV